MHWRAVAAATGERVEPLPSPRVVGPHPLQVPAVGFRGEPGNKRGHRVPHGPDERDVDTGPATDVLAPHIDLNDREIRGRVELPIREVGPEHD